MKIYKKRPEVSIENFPAVFDYYDQRGPNPTFARLGHWVMSQKFKPQISIDRDTREVLASEFRAGTLAMVLMNHLNALDQYNLASSVRLARPMRPIIGKTVIMAKIDSIFDKPGPIGYLRRVAVDELGSFPVVRQKDEDENASEELKQMRRDASDLSLLLGKNKTARDGLHLAAFPERGGRLGEDGDPTVVRELLRGPSEIYENLRGVRRVMVVPFGQYIGHGDLERRPTSPNMHIGMPVITDTRDLHEFTGLVHAEMQESVNQAVADRLRSSGQ